MWWPSDTDHYVGDILCQRRKPVPAGKSGIGYLVDADLCSVTLPYRFHIAPEFCLIIFFVAWNRNNGMMVTTQVDWGRCCGLLATQYIVLAMEISGISRDTQPLQPNHQLPLGSHDRPYCSTGAWRS